jgi:hypothetical protein
VIAVSPGDEALRQALAQVADLRRTDPAATVVLSLAPGDYALSGTLVVDARHAPPAGGGLRIRAADSARLPRLLGGRKVSGWRKARSGGRDGVWAADVSAYGLPARVKLFFCGGRRMEPARWPNVVPSRRLTTGYAHADGVREETARFAHQPGMWTDELKISGCARRHRWSRPEEGWVIVYPRHNWWNRAFDVTNMTAAGVLHLANRRDAIRDNLFLWDRWCVQGIREELDAPGEWFFDRAAGRLYFIPPDGVDPNAVDTSLAVAPEMVRIEKAGRVVLERLELACGGSGITVRSDDVAVLGCRLHDLGFYQDTALSLRGHRIRVADCDVWNIAGTGIDVVDTGESRVADRLAIEIENNYVHHCGQIYSHGIGIWIRGQGVAVRHNLVHDMPRGGIFGYGRFCEISYNRIRHVNLTNDDTGAIYGGGWEQGTGTRVCYNWVSDSIGYQRQKDGRYVFHKGACGVYPDEGCGGLAVYGNLIERCNNAALHLHNARWCVISNNVFVSNGARPPTPDSKQLSIQTWNANSNGYFMAHRRRTIAREFRRFVAADPRWLDFPAFRQAPDDDSAFNDDPTRTLTMGVQVVNNIFYYPDQGMGRAIQAAELCPRSNVFDRNVYWPGSGATNLVMYTSWRDCNDYAAWRARGHDRASRVADPMFRDAANGDFRLRPESPARETGFVDLPYERMGLRLTAFRQTLPVEAPGAREHPEWFDVVD